MFHFLPKEVLGLDEFLRPRINQLCNWPLTQSSC